MVLLSIALLAATASAKCFEPTVAHSPPHYDRHDPILKEAFASIEGALTDAVASPEYTANSFSVEVTSSEKSLWSFHHTALERNVSRPDIPIVNSDALYRIASITKTFTVLGVLYQHDAGNLSLDDPVNKYITELGEKSDGGIPWKDITLRSLASQLSGIPREFAQGDLINEDKWHFDAPSMGLPPLSRKELGLPECDEYSPNYETPCTVEDLLGALKHKRPVFAPNQVSTYSNVAFELLGIVLSRVTNQTYKSYMHSAIFDPLNMSKTTLYHPPDSSGVIPVEPHYWDIDEGIQSPTGGIFASSTDLSKYLRYTLTHFNAITHAINWLNPVSPSRDLNSFYGMPWEIFQTDRVLKDSRRTVRFITKGGGLPGYTSVIMTIPQYDLGITILLAGPPDVFSHLREIVTVAAVRAAEELSVRQLAKRYAGTYASTDTHLNSSMTLVADARGLVVKQLISNSTDVLASQAVQNLGLKDGYAQLVPTLLYRDEKRQRGEEWRILLTAERKERVGEIWDDFCINDVDTPLYAGVPVNEAVFWGEDKDGRLEKVELVAFRANLTRVEKKRERVVVEEQHVMEL